MIREYRQLVKGFMRENLKHRKDVEMDDDIRDVQSGHSSRTAELRYGISTEDVDGLTSNRLLAFFRVSQEWHELLGFEVKEYEIK